MQWNGNYFLMWTPTMHNQLGNNIDDVIPKFNLNSCRTFIQASILFWWVKSTVLHIYYVTPYQKILERANEMSCTITARRMVFISMLKNYTKLHWIARHMEKWVLLTPITIRMLNSVDFTISVKWSSFKSQTKRIPLECFCIHWMRNTIQSKCIQVTHETG